MATHPNTCKSDPGFKASSLAWLRAEATKIELVASDETGKPPRHCSKSGVVRGYVVTSRRAQSLDNVLTYEELPVEFFNHQLLDVDAEDPESVREFISRWGIPFSPLRGFGNPLASKSLPEETRRAIEETTWLERAYPKHVLAAGENKADDEVDLLIREFEYPAAGRIVANSEARDAILTLQQVAQMVTAVPAGESWNGSDLSYTAFVLNMGACNDVQVVLSHPMFSGLGAELDHGPAYRGGLSSAVCNQMVACIADPAPWRTCACVGCGKVYKRKQTESRKPDSDSVYCCDKCMERQKKRNQRYAARNRIQH